MTQDENIYRAPQAELLSQETRPSPAEFYIVSGKKCLILYIATLGLYSIYWFYRHWKCHKQAQQTDLWPALRALFSIFFTHALFRLFVRGAPEQARDLRFSADQFATLFVVGSIVSSIVDRMTTKGYGEPFLDYFSLAFVPLLGWITLRAQLVANAACDDPQGTKNDSFTVGNYIWLTIGGLLWIVTAISLIEVTFGLAVI